MTRKTKRQGRHATLLRQNQMSSGWRRRALYDDTSGLALLNLTRAYFCRMRDHSEVSRSLGAWLDEYMHESLHEVVERDSTILEVVYRVDIPMIDKDWLYYCEVVLTAVPEARAFHERLDTGKKALVQSTMNRGDKYGNAYGKRTVPRPMVRRECENGIFRT